MPTSATVGIMATSTGERWESNRSCYTSASDDTRRTDRRIRPDYDASRPDPQLLDLAWPLWDWRAQTGYGTVKRMAATESVLQALPA
jgi:hypothetical protein